MGIKILVTNRKASHDYELLDKYEAGLALVGTEVKSIRAGKANIADGWVEIVNGEAFLNDVHINKYSHGNQMNHAEKRTRRLLLNKKEIAKLWQKTEERGFSVIPTKMYLKGPYIKIELAVAKGKKFYDKRESEKAKETKRHLDRIVRHRG